MTQTRPTAVKARADDGGLYRKAPFALTAFVYVFFLTFVAVPVIFVLAYAFTAESGMVLGEGGFASDHFVRIFTNPVYMNVVLRSLFIGLVAMIFTVLISYLPSFYIALSSPKKQALLILLVVVPFWTPYVIRIFSWMQILSDNGPLNWLLRKIPFLDLSVNIMYSDIAVVLGLVYSGIPFMILPLYASMTAIDTRLYEAAENLGANSFVTFMRLTVPLSLPGLLSGAIMAFILAAGSYLAPVILGGPRNIMIAQLVYDRFLATLDWPIGSAIAIVYLVFVVVIVGLLRLAFARSGAFKINSKSA